MTFSSVTIRVSALMKTLCVLFIILLAGVSEAHARMFDPELGCWTRRDPLGYVDGMNVFAYVNGAPMVKTDPRGTIPIETCYDIVAQCLWEDPMILELIDKVRGEGCATPTVVCDDCWRSQHGLFECSGRADGSGIITICANNHPVAFHICETLRHEYVHALDSCNSGECFDVMDQSCAGLACSEIRAAMVSGECCKGGSAYNEGETYEQCVRSQAKASAGWWCRHAVDDVWPFCFLSFTKTNPCGQKIFGPRSTRSSQNGVADPGIGCHCGGPYINCREPCCA